MSFDEPIIAAEADAGRQKSLKNYLLAIYIMYIVGLFTGIFAVVGVVLAYVKREDFRGTVYESHAVYLIRTFWIALLSGFISVLLMLVLIGFLLICLVAVWYIVRLVKGSVLFLDGKPVENPRSWLF